MRGIAPKTSDTKAHLIHQRLSVSSPGKYLGTLASRLPTSAAAGAALTAGALALALAVCLAIDRWIVPRAKPGWFVLPIVALAGYRWGWRLGILATAVEVLLVWYFFTPPRFWQGLPGGDR